MLREVLERQKLWLVDNVQATDHGCYLRRNTPLQYGLAAY
jgi:hypothetical protein